jgi:hypothetical protein
LLVLEQILVHLPEVGLCSSALSCKRRGARMWMNLLEWKVAEDEAQAVREFALQLMHGMTR